MPIQSTFLNRRRIAIMLTLVTLLASVYMLTYSGRIESSDTRALFDTVSSLVQYGDTYLDISAWYNYPLPTARGFYPLVPSAAEPLQPILATPLFWIAQHLPNIGLAHAVWLFNVLICALAGGVFFLYALALGYSETTAVIGSLLLGFCTIIWPYSKTFFREPLALLLILLAALFIERWRSSGYRSIILFVAAGLALVGAWLSKEAVIFAIPALAILAAPALRPKPGFRYLVTGFLALVVISLMILVGVSILPGADSLRALYQQIGNLIHKSPSDVQFIHVALHSYLLSIGGSFWATSPVVLLAIPGLWMLYRRGHYRYVVAIVVLILTFATGYAVLRGVYWFGGLSWPPRFLIPMIPIVMIGTLPVVEKILARSARRWLVGLVAILVLYSLWVQLGGLLLPWEAYGSALPPEAHGLGEWGGGLNVVQYLRWVILTPFWLQQPLDLAWVRLNVGWWPIVFGGLAILCALLIYSFIGGEKRAKVFARLQKTYLVVITPIIFIVLVGFGLTAMYRDPLYLGDRDALHAILPTIASSGQPGDVLMLDNADHYDLFFMNYAKFNYPRVIALSDQPGERPSPEQPAKITSDNPDALLLKITAPLIQNLAVTRPRLWLLSSSGPWMPWRLRPVERLMAEHYYPIQELSTTPSDPSIRLIEFSTLAAPDPFGFRGAEHPTDLVYGQAIQLVGFTLPEGTAYRPGDVLPISLYWQADKTPEKDYTVAWFAVSADGSRVVQGADYQPGWGFAPTSHWLPNMPIWDNRALHLPADLQPGPYQIWIRLYQSDASDLLLPVTGTETDGENTGILPIRIDITP
ncbi:MAG: hypothetical protein ABI690_32100 [Chloroflexota bacterium]